MPHIHDKIDFVVNAFIVYKNKTLLIHHKKLNLWLPVGGHVELDEDPEQALHREVKEECGLEVKVLASKPTFKDEGPWHYKALFVPPYMDIHHYDKTHRHIALHYFTVSKSDKVKLAEREHNDIRWFSANEIEDSKWGITEPVRFYAHEALKAASHAERRG